MKEFIFSVLEFLSELGYFGIALGLMIEVIPSEIVLGYGGYMISEGILGYPGAIIAGTIGGTIAQLFLYWAGYYGGRPFLEKYGKYGVGVIFFARFIPVVRHAISIPAGIAKMSATKFTLYTVAAVIPWTILFLYLGHALGENWSHIKEYAAQYTMPIIIGALILGVIYYLIKKTKKTTTD
jgi:membrane protein DedA with SNARE-associated domain